MAQSQVKAVGTQSADPSENTAAPNLAPTSCVDISDHSKLLLVGFRKR